MKINLVKPKYNSNRVTNSKSMRRVTYRSINRGDGETKKEYKEIEPKIVELS